MDLKRFRVSNYRSIDDSDFVEADKLTVLIGRNESGKSNLLYALHHLNPSNEKRLPNREDDLPRHKKSYNYESNPTIIFSIWELDDIECKEFEKTYPEVNYSRKAYFARSYNDENPRCNFLDVPPVLDPDTEAEIRRIMGDLLVDLRRWLYNLSEENRQSLEGDLKNFETSTRMGTLENKYKHYDLWANIFTRDIDSLRSSFSMLDHVIPKSSEGHIEYLEGIANHVRAEKEKTQKALDWLQQKLPTFVYFDKYPEIYGKYNLHEFRGRQAARKQNPETRFEDELEARDISFIRLCKAAKINHEEIPLCDENTDKVRKNRMIEGGDELAEQINVLWRNTHLKIDIHLDGEWINVYIESQEGNISQTISTNQKGGMRWKGSSTKIHLDQQSLGFRWFFAFYVTFAAETDFGEAEDKILLLDEPGLHLHAQSQRDFLQHLTKHFKNQIIYTTHSPFMMPDQLNGVRFVRLGDDGTTKVEEDLKANSKDSQESFFREETALGLSFEQSKRLVPYVLIVEGDTDVSILRAVSYHFRHHKNQEEKAIRPDMAIKPAQGVGKVKLFTSILFAEKVGMMVLLDHEPSALIERGRLLLFNRVREENALTVSAAFGKSVDKFDKCADIEDVLGDELYGELVEASYPSFAVYKEKHSEKVKGFIKSCKTTRIANCYEEMFKQFRKKDEEFRTLKLKWDKVAPIEIFCKRMEDPKDARKMIQKDVEKRFEQLFERINQIKDDVFDEDDDEEEGSTGGEA